MKKKDKIQWAVIGRTVAAKVARLYRDAFPTPEENKRLKLM